MDLGIEFWYLYEYVVLYDIIKSIKRRESLEKIFVSLYKNINLEERFFKDYLEDEFEVNNLFKI